MPRPLDPASSFGSSPSITLRVPRDLLAALTQAAKRQGISPSAFAREAFEARLNELGYLPATWSEQST